MKEYDNCTLCPRNCKSNRTLGKTGVCGETDVVRAASAGIHFGEEPVITGIGGSGVFFFTGCTMGCSFCQNWQISQKGMGAPLTMDDFINISQKMSKLGAININLVTPGHFAPTLIIWIEILKNKGFDLPVLWNSSGFDSMFMLEKTVKIMDVYLPDLKSVDMNFSSKYFKARDYPETAKKAIKYIVKRKPLVYSKEGLLLQGVIVRHLVMPGRLDNTQEVLRWFSSTIGGEALISIMTQYTPVKIPGNTTAVPNSYVSNNEADKVLSMLEKLNLENGFIQESEQNNEWLPDFSREKPFPSKLYTPIWSWESGFLY